MSEPLTKMRFCVESRRIDAHQIGSVCKSARINLDPDMGGKSPSFNPAELLLAALSFCMIKGTDLAGVMRRA